MECSVVRLGDGFRNQFEEMGHTQSLRDLDAVAALGIKTLRYPVLWETVSPESPMRCDWSFADESLGKLQALGIRPIAGLVHHGSGPRYTSLLDRRFPQMLARHARNVAERFPWIEMYTPVNEPLTTARFSGLYGHWFPHGTSAGTFLRCLVNQCLATLLAMREIRKVNPAAKLVQTEDLGKIFGSPKLAYQADYENERRWLSLDLLCGRVDETHPWHDTLLRNGIGVEELAELASGDGQPDIIGINYYATSERYLDQAWERYPDCFHGGNGRHRYADVEALRMDLPPGTTGIAPRLREAWDRYGLPLAVTEVHHGSTREEQLRWLAEVWEEAGALKREGVDVRAVTAWSLLGALDWNSLLTQRRGFYETGAFDIRGPQIRMTAIGKALRQIAETGRVDHPVLDQPGWWRREGRHYHPPVTKAPALLKRPRMMLLLGASGKLGRELEMACAFRGLDVLCPPRQELELGNSLRVESALDRYRPWAVINAAAPLDDGGAAVEALAQACARRSMQFMGFASSRVFDGRLGRAYVESDETSPACRAGLLEAETEERVLRANPQALIIRMSRLFGCADDPAALHQQWVQRIGVRPFFTATYLPDVVRVALDLLIDGETGRWHLSSSGAVSVEEFSRIFPAVSGYATPEAPLVLLGSERAQLMPSLADALVRQRDLLTARSAEMLIAAE